MNVYEELGLTTLINASDTYTIIGGSRMSPEVVEAMAQAARCFVDIVEMENKVGEAIAGLTRNEDCCVCSGAAAGIMLSAAACMAGNDPLLSGRLPDSEGMKNEFLICSCQKGASVSFWHMIESAGGRIIWLDSSVGAFEAAIGPMTAGLFCFPGDAGWEKALSIAELVSIGRKHGIPVVVDAAAQLPPLERLWEYTTIQGADLVIFSGGKYIMGPQTTGLILGKKDLIRACKANASPNCRIGRPAKVGKEELAGIYAAVKRLMSLDFEALTQTYHGYLDEIMRGLRDIPGLTLYKQPTGTLGQAYPLLIINLPTGKDSKSVQQAMRAGNPAIDIRGFFWKDRTDELFINPICLDPGEPAMITRRLRAYFLGGSNLDTADASVKTTS